MSSAAEIQVVRCPAALVREALALVLREIAPEQRAEIVPPKGDSQSAAAAAVDGMWIARHEEQLCGAAWGQRQPGNTAILWPPQLADGTDPLAAVRLGQAVVESLDDAGVVMTQVLLPEREAAGSATLIAVGFRHLADLLYLSWDTAILGGQSRDAAPQQPESPLEFEPFVASQRQRLSRLVERTYEGTQDCAALDGKRPIDEVIDGYRASGVFRPENWLFVRAGDEDVGVLLLADHPAARHIELVYMGLVPAARGHGWGLLVAQHAQQIAARARVERVVLAVDAANWPALAMYRDAGFVAWDRRSVFVRFRPA